MHRAGAPVSNCVEVGNEHFASLSVNIPKDDFHKFVETLAAALRETDNRESPMSHINPIIVRENGLAAVESDE